MSVSENLKILLVNDNRDEVSIFGQALRKIDQGIVFESAQDGTEALVYLRDNAHQPPDMIVIDEHNFFFLRKIRSKGEYSQIPVTVYTNSTNPEDIDMTIEYGASFLPKPVSYRVLVKLLKNKIDRMRTKTA